MFCYNLIPPCYIYSSSLYRTIYSNLETMRLSSLTNSNQWLSSLWKQWIFIEDVCGGGVHGSHHVKDCERVKSKHNRSFRVRPHATTSRKMKRKPSRTDYRDEKRQGTSFPRECVTLKPAVCILHGGPTLCLCGRRSGQWSAGQWPPSTGKPPELIWEGVLGRDWTIRQPSVR